MEPNNITLTGVLQNVVTTATSKSKTATGKIVTKTGIAIPFVAHDDYADMVNIVGNNRVVLTGTLIKRDSKPALEVSLVRIVPERGFFTLSEQRELRAEWEKATEQSLTPLVTQGDPRR